MPVPSQAASIPRRPKGEKLIKVLEKARKLFDMVRLGTAGEQVAAKGILDELLKKNELLPVHLERFILFKEGKLKPPPPPRPAWNPWGGRVVIFTGGFGGFGSMGGSSFFGGTANTSTASGATNWNV